MDCNKTNTFMTHYMDGNLTEDEEHMLNSHLVTCSKCKEDFSLYDTILEGFATMEVLEAPVGFEDAVMCKINALPNIHEKTARYLENVSFWIWGSFSVLAGVGFLLFINQEALMQYFYANPQLAGVAELFEPVSQFVTAFSSQYYYQMQDMFADLSVYLAGGRYVILAILAVLALLQIFVHKESKVK